MNGTFLWMSLPGTGSTNLRVRRTVGAALVIPGCVEVQRPEVLSFNDSEVALHVLPWRGCFGSVRRFRSKFAGDAGLDGCLLELEEVLKLKQTNTALEAAVLALENGKWMSHETVKLPSASGKQKLNELLYQETGKQLEVLFNSGSIWHIFERL